MSSVRMLVRIISSSSTSSTEGLRLSGTLLSSFLLLLQFLLLQFLLLQRNPDVESGPAAPFALEGDRSPVVFHRPPHHQQTETRADAHRLSRESPLQDFWHVLLANSMAGI